MDSVAEIDFTLPLAQSFSHDGLESDLKQAALTVFKDTMGGALQDLVDYGCPHIGSRTVIERFAKQDGLVVLRRNSATDKIMQTIFAAWSGLGSERGLNFLSFVLTMLWRDQWQLQRLWHSIGLVEQYPKFVQPYPDANSFLTSRVNLEIKKEIDLNEIVELVPMVRKLVPAHIVMSVSAEELNIAIIDKTVGVAIGAKMLQFVDLTI